MRERCPGSELLAPVRLAGYILAFGGDSVLRSGGVATIRPHHDGLYVEGVLYRMTAEDWASLDHWESFPEKYGRKDVSVMNGEGLLQDAQTYYLKEYYPNPPSAGYRDIIARGYAVHGLDPRGLDLALAACNGEGEQSG